MAGRGRRVRKAKINFQKNKLKVRAELNKQQSYINQYWQFAGGDPKFKGAREKSANVYHNDAWTTGGGIQDKHIWRGNGLGMGGVNKKLFTYMSPDSAYNRHTGQNRHNANTEVHVRSKKSYASLASGLKQNALLASLGELDVARNNWNNIKDKEFDSSTVRSSRNFGSSQKGSSNYVSAKAAVLIKNQGDNDASIAAKMKTIETQYATQYYDDPSSSNYGKIIEGTDKSDYIARIKASLVSTKNNNNKTIIPNVSKGGTGFTEFMQLEKKYEQDPYTWGDNPIEKESTTYAYYTKSGEHDNFANIQSVREPTAAEKADIFGFDKRTGESSEGRDSHLIGLGMAPDIVGKSNKDIISIYNKKQKENKADVINLNKLKQKLDHAYLNRRAHGSEEKVDKIKAEIKLKFPDINISGNSKQVSQQLSLSVYSKSQTIANTKKKQDSMALYVAKDKINTSDKHRGAAVGHQNLATQRAVDKSKAEAAQAAAQKKYDDMWASGGYALLSDKSNNNIQSLGQANFNNTNSNGKSLQDKVKILKRYDSWGQRDAHIGSELSQRETSLNRYYNSNYLQDFTYSDKKASQSMFGTDEPTAHSLAYSSMSEIGFNQKNPRTAISSLNKILSKTDTDRQDYAESLSGIETKLSTLKEKQALKRKANKSVEADIARQVKADISEGNIDVNTEFRDKITGTSEELYDVNSDIAEHNILKSYYSKSISQTDEDVGHLKDRLEEVIEVKKRNDYETIVSFTEDGGQNVNRSKSSAIGYNNSNRFRRRTGANVKRVRGGRGNNLSGLVI